MKTISTSTTFSTAQVFRCPCRSCRRFRISAWARRWAIRLKAWWVDEEIRGGSILVFVLLLMVVWAVTGGDR